MKKIALNIIVLTAILQGCFEKYTISKSAEQRIMETKQAVATKVKEHKMDPIPVITEISDSELIYLLTRNPFVPKAIYTTGGISLPQKIRMPFDPSRAKNYQTEPFEKHEI